MKVRGQLIFVDDSGDPGFKLARASSRLFVIACVIFDDIVDAEFASASIKKLKKEMGWKQEREFKFHRASEEQKESFFRALKLLNFRVCACVVDKTLVSEPKMKKDDSFYQKVIFATLDRISTMRGAKIYLDGKAGKNYRNRSVSKIRKVLNKSSQRMVSLKLEDSKDDVLIQLADMIAGSIRVKCDPERFIKKDYLAIIADKVEEIYFYHN